MAEHSRQVLLIAFIVSCLAVLATAGIEPGHAFPYFSNCRRQQEHQRRIVTYSGIEYLAEGVVQHCFLITLNQSTCVPEIFLQKGKEVTSRCCDTELVKIKFYVNSACKGQFLPSYLTVPLAPELTKLVSPVWDVRKGWEQDNYTTVKYTQFGPIPQSVVNGTRFCLAVGPETGAYGKHCLSTNLGSLTNPLNLNKGIFQLSLFDKKRNDYECCPTFSYRYSTTGPGRKPRVKRYRRVARKLEERSRISKFFQGM